MNPSDFLFCVEEAEGAFCLTSKKYWEEEGHLDDCLPSGFANLMEAMWEYYDSSITNPAELVQAGKRKLLDAGFVWSEEMNQYINSQ